jgi:hypothetical protein
MATHEMRVSMKNLEAAGYSPFGHALG